MGLKNWTLKTEAISKGSQGLGAFVRYLTDINHPNHKSTQEIVHIFGDANSFLRQANIEALDRQARNQLAGKGGRPISSFAQSFMLSLPPNHKPTDKQWRAIAKDLVRVIARKTGAKKGDLEKRIFINIHQEAIDRNSHLNIVVSKVWDKEIKDILKQKSILSELKNTANKSILKHCGWDNSFYNPKQTGLGSLKKWQYQQKQANDSIKLLARLSSQLSAWLSSNTPEKSIKTIKRAQRTIEQAKRLDLDLHPFAEFIESSENTLNKQTGLHLKPEYRCKKCNSNTVSRKGATCIKCQANTAFINNNNRGLNHEKQTKTYPKSQL